MAAAENVRCNLSVEEEIHAPHSTTSTFRATSARLEILHQCRQYSDDVQFNQSDKFPQFPRVFQAPNPFLVVQFVVAVVDEDTGEIWACNTTPAELHQIYVTRDGMFRIVPEVEPYAWMLARDVDCRNKSVPPYAGNLTFMLPFKREKPSRHAVRIKLCQGVADCNWEVLDAVQFIIASHERGSHYSDFQSGRTVTDIEKPIPRIQMQGVLAKKMGRTMRAHFVNLGDNGQYDQFLRDRQKLVERVDGIVRFQDLLLAVELEVAKLYYIQNRKEDCLAKCRDVCERATHLNSGNWPFLLTRAFYIISAVYRQTKEFDLANEYMDKSSECLEPAILSDENAVNRYNAAALLAEKSAAVGLTADEEQKAERLFEEVAEIWAQQKENDSMRCVIRGYNRMIMYFLKTSRARFPDLRKEVSEVNIAKAGIAIQKVERNLLARCPKRLKATFLIGKADYFIRRATRRGLGVSEVERNLDFQRAKDELDKAMRISRALMMQKEIEGIEDRTRTIQDLIARGLWWFDDPPPPEPAEGNEPVEGNTNDLEDLFQNLLISEEEENRRREDQCTD